ncbi:MAG: PD40 domain-containing protein [Acidobacteria bacterium]|nr:PD40 domain-containing protein [Acidobacteriota bacterium]
MVFLEDGAVKAVSLAAGAAKADRAVVVDGRYAPRPPSFSPDGRRMVYASSDAGVGLYVQPYPGSGSSRQIAPDGFLPTWRKDGKEILYRRGTTLMAVPVAWGAGPSFGSPRALFTGLKPPAGSSMMSQLLAVSRDGARIFSAQGIDQPEANVIHINTGAFDGLR